MNEKEKIISIIKAEKFSMWMKDTNAQTQEQNKPKTRQAGEGHASTHCVS